MGPRMRRWRLAIAVLLALGSAPAVGAELKLERVVMLMRHGIRPPTQLQPIPPAYSPRTWPTWSVGPGLLTDHGAKGIALLGAADRAELVRRGLLPATGCPARDALVILASKVPRAIATAQAWAASFAPGCAITVSHPPKDEPDTLFHPLEAEPSWFDGDRARRDALKAGGPEAAAKRLKPELRLMERVLGCDAPQCDLEHRASTLAARPHDRPSLKGPLNVSATASETFLLEYLENKPMAEVGWGLVDRAAIERLLGFTAVKFRFEDRPLYIAKAAAGPLANAMLEALTEAEGARVALFAGHDTNIADLAGLLDLHWRVPTYPHDTVPPGSVLGFELLSDDGGRHFVRAFYRSQDMDQLRDLQPLTGASASHRFYIRIPECGRAVDPESCRLDDFAKLVRAKLQTP
jgi:4-phytase/acid phosphatase